MQAKGTIIEWKDDRGFGFIEPSGGGERVFCHIKSFAVRVRRPMAGDIVTYRAVKDAKGRVQAAEVRPVGLEKAAYNANVGAQPARSSRPVSTARHSGSPIAAYTFVAMFFEAIVALVVVGRVNFFVPLIYAALSLLTWLFYAFDKSAAMNKRWRTKEQTLHALELIGGWPGGLIAQRMFHHKSRKTSFLVEFWMCVVLNLAALGTFAWKGEALLST